MSRRAITSQNGTAPKHSLRRVVREACAITSQNGTAPKHSLRCVVREACAITSQNGTAPKHDELALVGMVCAITSQNGTAPKQPYPNPLGSAVRLPVRTALLQNAPLVKRFINNESHDPSRGITGRTRRGGEGVPHGCDHHMPPKFPESYDMVGSL